MSAGLELLFELCEVFDDPVVHQSCGRPHVWVCVHLCGRAVSCPACVAENNVWVLCNILEIIQQLLQAPRLFMYVKPVVGNPRHPGRVVPAVLEGMEAGENATEGAAVSHSTDDPTHLEVEFTKV